LLEALLCTFVVGALEREISEAVNAAGLSEEVADVSK